MTINEKLFHLGNDVVQLEKLINQRLGKLPQSHWQAVTGACALELFLEMLKLINHIRLACNNDQIPKDLIKKNWHSMSFWCDQEDVELIESFAKNIGAELSSESSHIKIQK